MNEIGRMGERVSELANEQDKNGNGWMVADGAESFCYNKSSIEFSNWLFSLVLIEEFMPFHYRSNGFVGTLIIP